MAILSTLRYSFYVFTATRTIPIVVGIVLFSAALPVLSGVRGCWDAVVGLSDSYTISPSALYWVLALLVGYRLFSDEKESGLLNVILTKPLGSIEFVLGKLVSGILVLVFAYLLASIVGIAYSLYTGSCSTDLAKALLYPVVMAVFSTPLMLLASLGGLLRGGGMSLQLGVGAYVASRIVNVMVAVRGAMGDITGIIEANVTSLRDLIMFSIKSVIEIEALNPITNTVILAKSILDSPVVMGVTIQHDTIVQGLVYTGVVIALLVLAHVVYVAKRL